MVDELEELKKKRMEELKKKMEYPDKPITVDDRTLPQIIQKYPKVVVDCWATWCMPCKMIEPAIEELAQEHQGEIVYGKLNIDQNRQTAQKYRIMSIPALLVFKNGQQIDTIIGAMPKPQLQQKIQEKL